MLKPHWRNQADAAIAPCLPAAFGVSTMLLLYGCTARSPHLPAAVTQAFAARYANASVGWAAKPYGYEGVFYRNGIQYEAEFTADGRWLETEHEVSAADFSQAVLDRVKREYPGYTISKHEIEQTPQGTFYEVEIQQANSEYELYFDSSATPVQNANEDS